MKEVNRLRKEGKIEEALSLAQKNLNADSNNIWNKRAIAWVYYEYLKCYAEEKNTAAFIAMLQNIRGLESQEPEDMLMENVAIAIGKIANSLNDRDRITALSLEVLQHHFPYNKERCSFMIKNIIKKAEPYIDLYLFFDWCDPNRFCPKDFETWTTDDGISILSLVEQIYISLAKNFLISKNKAYLEKLLVPIGILCARYPQMTYMDFYHGKLLLALNDRQRFLKAFLPFAKKKQRNFWVWDFLSEAFEADSQEYFACLCKSLSLGAPGKFTIRVKEKFAQALLLQNKQAEAKHEILDCIKIREQNAWKASKNIQQWVSQAWFPHTTATANNHSIYQAHIGTAAMVLLADLPRELIVVENVNKPKKVFNYISKSREEGFCSYGDFDIEPQIGSVLWVRFQKPDKENKSNYRKLLSLETSQELVPELKKVETGVIIIKEGNSFGFVNSVFIPPHLIQASSISHGQQVKVQCLQSYNKKHKSWGWKAIELSKIS